MEGEAVWSISVPTGEPNKLKRLKGYIKHMCCIDQVILIQL